MELDNLLSPLHTPLTASPRNSSQLAIQAWVPPGDYDPCLISAQYAEQLFRQLQYNDASKMKVFEVVDGCGRLCQANDIADLPEPATQGDDSSTCGAPACKIILIHQNTNFQKLKNLTEDALAGLFGRYNLPTEFIEVMVNNNGALTSSVRRHNESHDLSSFDLFIKCPASMFLNAAICFTHNLKTQETIIIVIGVYLEGIIDRLQHLFPAPKPNTPRQIYDDPFIFLSLILAEYSASLECRRRDLDLQVCTHEAKTGASARKYAESFRAQAKDYEILSSKLRATEGFLNFLHRTLYFQVELVGFVQEQHSNLKHILSRQSKTKVSTSPGSSPSTPVANSQQPPNQPVQLTGSSIPITESSLSCPVSRSLRQTMTLSKNRLRQTEGLMCRIKVQLTVVQDFSAQHDRRLNIVLAELNQKIATATMGDSRSMKAIAAITMFFLPATFAATFFSMTFFRADTVDGHDTIHVNSYWWLYLPVTLGLTFLVFGFWYMREVRRRTRAAVYAADEERLG